MTQMLSVVVGMGERLVLYWHPMPSVEMVVLGARLGRKKLFLFLTYCACNNSVYHNISIKFLYL